MNQGTYDLLVVGAGPAGLGAAIEGQRRGLRVLVVDRGGVADHIRRFPIGMAFFTPGHTLELAGLPLDIPRRHPTREDALSYYTRVARVTGLEVRAGRALGAVTGGDGDFTVTLGDGAEQVRTRKIVIATGVFGQPRRLTGVPGLELPKVSYGYQDPHEVAGLDVVIVGVGNGAAEAAMRFCEADARVTVLNRGASIPESRWRWRVDDLVALERAGAIRVMHQATLRRIEPARVIVEAPGGEVALRNDRVILLLGFEPSTELFDRLGIAYDPDTLAPRVDPGSLESSVPGIHLAGIVLSGTIPDRVFIHGSRNHGKTIVAHVLGDPAPRLQAHGLDSIDHWNQAEQAEEELDPALALDLVPVVIGDHRDNLVDVHVYWAFKNGYTTMPALEPAGSVLDAMEGWRFKREPDGGGLVHGRRCSSDVLELLRRADGTRRIRDIIEELVGEYDQPFEELRELVLPMFLALLRTGTIAWRSSRISERGVR